MKIAVYGNTSQSRHLVSIKQLMRELCRRGAQLLLEPRFYEYLVEASGGEMLCCSPVKSDDFEADMAFSIGGDGTFLRTAQWIGKKEIPIIGINTGHLGYLADLGLDECFEWLDEVLSGNCEVEDRTMITAFCPERALGLSSVALNEVAILKQDTASMIDMDVRVNDATLASYLGDGLIVCTPTGSTGYNLSVGGPIVAPSAPVWVISPIAAHSLTMRPLVVDDGSVISVTTRSRVASYRLSIDGRSVSLPVGSTVVLRRADFVTRILKRRGHNFTDTLREKLFWGADNR
ncbi:MAG: NAD kinase [Muribaculum sp.]|nr:NAD kinase [Muribaculum sp.]